MSDFYLMESIKAEDAIVLDRLMYYSSAKSFLDGMDIQLRTTEAVEQTQTIRQ